MGKLKFGVSSIVLGKEQKTENLRYDSVEWGEATTIQDFFRAGGNPSSVTPTRCKFLYTAEKLFVLFENMEEKAHHILKEENTVTELTVKRKDQVEVALSGKEFSRRDFAVFTAKRDDSKQLLWILRVRFHEPDPRSFRRSRKHCFLDKHPVLPEPQIRHG